MPPPDADKPALRALLRARLAAVSPASAAAWSGEIDRRLAARVAAAVEARGVVVGYAPVAAWREVDVEPALRRVLGAGGRVALTRMGPCGALEPVEITDWDRDLVAGARGIREPRTGLRTCEVGDIAAVIVPGLAFDPAGRRLGRGLGYYDRFLGALPPAAARIGVAFEVQIVPEVPVEGHDQRVRAVITEGRVIA